MAGLFDWLGKLVRDDAEHKTQIRIGVDHVLIPGHESILLAAEQHYVRLWLVEMFLRENTSWFTKRYPLTYSLVETNAGGKATEFANVSGKNRLEIKQTDLGRSLLYNYPMTPLLPFKGGTISLDCGLVSMTASNVVTKFAGVVSEFAGKLGGAQIAAATDIASSIASSVQDLLGAGDAVSKLYYHNAFTGAEGGAPLTSGYIFLSEKVEGKVDPARLWVTSDGVREGNRGGPLQPLDPQDYLLIQIECVSERDDYRAFSYISEPFEQALDAKGEGDDAKGQLLLRQAKRAVQRSADFTKVDAKRIAAALDKAYSDDGWSGEMNEAVSDPVERFERSRFVDALSLVSIDEALELPDRDDGASGPG
ncbi:MAG TPA: hypothetical protein VK403_13395 [Allosphingosinicella sp.]|nr:hypothetical protein [Allosphingosinicella sp.]